MTRRSPLLACCLALALVLPLVGCEDETTPEKSAKTLSPEPDGAPSALADGDLDCLGRHRIEPPDGGNVLLTGHVRTLADPDADDDVPGALVQALAASGTELGQGYADTKDGRTTITVPAPTAAGFTGTARITYDGYPDYYLSSNLPYTRPDFNGWTWLATAEEIAQKGEAAGITLDLADGIAGAAIHGCDGFGVANAVAVVVDGEGDVVYADGFSPDRDATFTDASGRFLVMGLPAGEVGVEAYGRLSAGGPLVLLAEGRLEVRPGAIATLDLAPRQQ